MLFFLFFFICRCFSFCLYVVVLFCFLFFCFLACLFVVIFIINFGIIVLTEEA